MQGEPYHASKDIVIVLVLQVLEFITQEMMQQRVREQNSTLTPYFAIQDNEEVLLIKEGKGKKSETTPMDEEVLSSLNERSVLCDAHCCRRNNEINLLLFNKLLKHQL